jgi:inorganic pyrophosphatase/exopolyphosphatase
MGNTSADMDSVLSSILLSFALNISNGIIDRKLNENKEVTVLSKDLIYLPLINTEHRIFISKLDIKFLFNLYGIDYNNLIFIDQIGTLLTDNESINLILVDHNKLDPMQEVFVNKVISIYDHHEDFNVKYKNIKEKHLMFPVGSCSTIVLMNQYVSNKEIMTLFSNQNLEFLCTAIWLDTKGFLPELKHDRWINLDQYAFDQIACYGKVDIKVFSEIIENKYNLKANLELGIEFLMSKDQKNFEYKLSEHYHSLITQDMSVPKENTKVRIKWASLQIDYLTMKEKFGEEKLLSYFDSHDIDLYITNSEYKGNKLVTFYFTPSNNTIFNNKLKETFLTNLLQAMKENTIEVMDTNVANLHTIKMSVKVSRKTLEPLIRRVLESLN